jgi:hypothetical protein
MIIQKSKASADSMRRVQDSVTAASAAAAVAARLPGGGLGDDSTTTGGRTNMPAGGATNNTLPNNNSVVGSNTSPNLNPSNNALNNATAASNPAGTPPPTVPPVPPVTNTLPGTNTSPATSEPPAGPVPPAYVKADGDPHYFVFAFPKMEARTMGLKAALTDYNTLKFGGQPLESSVQFFEGLNRGVVVVKGLINASAAKAYARSVASTPKITKDYKEGEVPQFIISEANFRKLMADKTIAPYLNFYKKNY